MAIRVTRDTGSMCYWHVSNHFCAEVIDEIIDEADRAKKKKKYDKHQGLRRTIHVGRESESRVKIIGITQS